MYYSNLKTKITIFTLLLLGMIYYIGWVFYISEPKYIDNCYKKVEKYDYVSIPEWNFNYDHKVVNGIVLQVDSNSFVVKINKFSTQFLQLNIKGSQYRIIGKGTIYHKVNDYVGFNIMLITQIFIGILTGILIHTLVSLLDNILN